MTKEETITARIRVAEDVWRKAKAKAAMDGIPVEEWVGKLVEKEVERR